MLERSCVFAFDMICEAASVSVSEDEAANASGPFHLCSQHYYATYSLTQVLVNVHCVVAKADIVQVVTSVYR